MKIKLLVEGWTMVPHSYAIVNCFQLIHLQKNYGDKLEIYIKEMDYYNPKWYSSMKLVYPEAYKSVLKSFKKWNGEKVDLVYRITYPYNVENADADLKKIVFYTSEFGKLNNNYFQGLDSLNFEEYLSQNKNLYFTGPSIWSCTGLKNIVEDSKNRIITHGVDLNIFKKDLSCRNDIRKKYNVQDDDILLVNIGAMTKNKGITLLIQALHYLKHNCKDKVFKLLLKGSGDLYECKEFLKIYSQEFKNANVISEEDLTQLFNENIIFIDKTFSFKTLNEIYNACDLYVSPYLAEGFNLTVLEALTSGLSIMVPRTGSTKEFVRDIYSNSGSKLIHYIKSNIVIEKDGAMYNYIELSELIEKLKEFEKSTVCVNDYEIMRKFIEKEYSWNKVSHLMYDYFNFVLKN